VAIGLAGLALGGCQINAIDLAQALRGRGHAVFVFGFVDDQVRHSVIPYAEANGVEVELLPAGGLRATARQMSVLAEAHRTDVVHVFGPWLGPAAAVASTTWRERAVVETNWNMENFFWGSPHVPLIVGTGAMAAEARRRRRAAVHLMEPPVNTSVDHPEATTGARFREQHGIGDDELLGVVVSRLDHDMKAEGIEYAIECLRAPELGRLRLVIVGDGDARAALASAAESVNRALGRPAVTLVGPMLHPAPAYAAADVVLGMGGSAIRGLAHGKPVIVLGVNGFALTYRPGSVPHFRENGFYGVDAPEGGVAMLTKELIALLDHQLRRDLGQYGLDEVRDRFGLDAAAASLEAIYRDALSARPSALSRRVTSGILLGRNAAGGARRLIGGGHRGHS